MLSYKINELVYALYAHAHDSQEKLEFYQRVLEYTSNQDYKVMYDSLAYFLRSNKELGDEDLFVKSATVLFKQLDKNFEPLREELFSAIWDDERQKLALTIIKLPESILNRPLLPNLAKKLQMSLAANKTPLQCIIATRSYYLIPVFLNIKHDLIKEDLAVKLDQHGRTLLHYVCQYGYPNLVTYLLHQGADVNAKWKRFDKKYTPVDLAFGNQDRVTCEILKAHGAEMTQEQETYCRCKHYKQNLILAKKENEFDNPDLVQIIMSRIYSYDDNHQKTIDAALRKLVEPNSILGPMLEITAYIIHNHQYFSLVIQKKLRIFIVEGPNIRTIKEKGKNAGGLTGKNSIYVACCYNFNAMFGYFLHELKHYADIVLERYAEQHFNRYKHSLELVKPIIYDFLKSLTKATQDKVMAKFSVVIEHYELAKHTIEFSVKVPEVIGVLGIEEGMVWLNKNFSSLLKTQEIFNKVCFRFLNDLKKQSLTETDAKALIGNNQTIFSNVNSPTALSDLFIAGDLEISSPDHSKSPVPKWFS